MLLRGNDKKTGRREGAEPIESVFTYVLYTGFLLHDKIIWFKIAGLYVYKKKSKR